MWQAAVTVIFTNLELHRSRLGVMAIFLGVVDLWISGPYSKISSEVLDIL